MIIISTIGFCQILYQQQNVTFEAPLSAILDEEDIISAILEVCT